MFIFSLVVQDLLNKGGYTSTFLLRERPFPGHHDVTCVLRKVSMLLGSWFDGGFVMVKLGEKNDGFHRILNGEMVKWQLTNPQTMLDAVGLPN